MQPSSVEKKPTSATTSQEIFISLSLLIFGCLWLPLCIEKYPNPQVNVGLYLLLFSFLSSMTGCLFFLISIIGNFPGYQSATPLCLVVSLVFGVFGQFVFDHQYCNAYQSSVYGSCYIAELLSFTIYLLSNYYLLSLVLCRTKFQLGTGTADAQTISKWFGTTMRMKILSVINISELIVILFHIHIYSYFAQVHVALGVFDIIWVAFCTILVGMSILLRFPKCVPILTHPWLLVLLTVIAVIAFGIGTITAWKYRITNDDGMARIGNVFIWCIVNLWLLVEFIATDNKMMYTTVSPIIQTQQKVSVPDNSITFTQ